jgi:hypothetical protein
MGYRRYGHAEVLGHDRQERRDHETLGADGEAPERKESRANKSIVGGVGERRRHGFQAP